MKDVHKKKRQRSFLPKFKSKHQMKIGANSFRRTPVLHVADMQDQKTVIQFSHFAYK
jgi:hypothetical protein